MTNKPITNAIACRHGNFYFCQLCRAEQAPKCRHGHPFFCAHCGKVPHGELRNLIPYTEPAS